MNGADIAKPRRTPSCVSVIRGTRFVIRHLQTCHLQTCKLAHLPLPQRFQHSLTQRLSNPNIRPGTKLTNK